MTNILFFVIRNILKNAHIQAKHTLVLFMTNIPKQNIPFSFIDYCSKRRGSFISQKGYSPQRPAIGTQLISKYVSWSKPVFYTRGLSQVNNVRVKRSFSKQCSLERKKNNTHSLNSSGVIHLNFLES